MDKKRSIQRNTGRKRSKPRMRFNFWVLVLIFVLSFLACFILYLLAANINKDFFEDEFNASISELVDPTGGVPATEPPTDQVVTENADTKKERDITVTNPIPQSEPMSSSYFGRCTLLTDAALFDMSKYGSISQVIGNKELGAAKCGTVNVDSSFGTLNIVETMKLKKPDVLYIMLGSDIGTSSVDDMIAGYRTMVEALHSALPYTDIYIMEFPPVYEDSDKVTNDNINKYNSKLLSMADSVGVYCIDTNTPLKGPEGRLAADYWSEKEKALNEKAYTDICNYILSHTV